MPTSAAILVMSWIDLLVNVQLLPRAARQAKAGVVVPLTAGAVLTMPLGVLLLLVVDAADHEARAQCHHPAGGALRAVGLALPRDHRAHRMGGRG